MPKTIEDKQLSEKLTEVEEKLNRYLARQVESADKDQYVSHDTNGGEPRPLEKVVSWIECSRDKRSWAEVHDEESGASRATVSFNRTDARQEKSEHIHDTRTDGSASPRRQDPPDEGEKICLPVSFNGAREQFQTMMTQLEKSIQILKTQGEESNTSKLYVCDVFSPPRVCAAAREQGLSGGWSINKSCRGGTTGKVFGLQNKSDQKDINNNMGLPPWL